jgi:hypothetical protein
MLIWPRWIAGSILLLLFIWVAALNIAIIWVRVFKNRYSSWIPIVGGLSGAAAFKILPLSWLNDLWWLPLLLDMGSLPLLTWTLVFLIFYLPHNKVE